MKWCQRGDKSQECGVEQSRVSVSTLSAAAAPLYLSSACDYKWSQFDGSSHAAHGDISYSSHNAVIDILEPVGRHGDDSTAPISRKHSDMLTEFLSLCRRHQYLTPPRTNHTWGAWRSVVGIQCVFLLYLSTASLLNTHFTFGTVRKDLRLFSLYFVSENLETWAGGTSILYSMYWFIQHSNWWVNCSPS